MNNRVARFVMVLIVVAIYLSGGVAIGTYYHNYIFNHVPQTFWQTVWQGGFHLFNRTIPTLLEDQAYFMFFWPIFIILSLGSWILYGISYFIFFLASGIAKLLGVG